MPDATALDQATAMIEKAWAAPIDVLENLAVRRPVEDPLLRSAMHIRSSLVVSNNAVAVHQDRLHALTRRGHVPAFHDLERITSSAVDLRVAQAESRIALQAISHVIEAREAAVTADRTPSLSLAQAAVARSACPGPATGPARPVGRCPPHGGHDRARTVTGQRESSSRWAAPNRESIARASSTNVSSTRRPSEIRRSTTTSPPRCLPAWMPTAHCPSATIAMSPTVHGRPAPRILRSSPAPSQCLLDSATACPFCSVRPCAATRLRQPAAPIHSPARRPPPSSTASSPTADLTFPETTTYFGTPHVNVRTSGKPAGQRRDAHS